MARQKITEKTVANLKTSQGRVEVWDSLLPGFGVRVTSKGVRTWFAYTRVSGKPVRITLGRYPVMGLSEARSAARLALEQAGGGGDPRPKPPPARKTLEGLIDGFEQRHLVKLRPKSRAETLRYLRGRFLERFAGRAPETLKRAEIRALLDDMIDEGRTVSANRMLAAVRKFMNWAVERGEIELSPCLGLRSPAKEVQRDRFLSMEDVARLWDASAVLSPINSAFIRVLLLTGQRRETVAQMRRSQIADGVWTIPREAMKGGRRHTVPLPELVRDIINETPATGEGDLVFSIDGVRRIAGYSKLKTQLDGASGLTDWRLHDLRRTAGTHIARLGFPRIVVSKILGHTEAGVTQIYELYTYDEEKRAALQAWAEAVRAVAGSATPAQARGMGIETAAASRRVK